MPRKKIIPQVAEKEIEEEIHAFTQDQNSVAVAVGLVEDGEFIPGQIFDTIYISGPDFEDLMSADGGGLTPGKPAGTFRKDDLWPFIDRVRDRN